MAMGCSLSYSIDDSARKGCKKEKKTKHQKRIPLWYFLYELLDVDMNSEIIEWADRRQLEFTIKDPDEVAKLWGLVKEKSTMTYAKLARGIRYYYGKGVIEKVSESRFAYRFVRSNKTKSVIKSGNETASAPTSPLAIPKRLHTYSASNSPLPHSPLLLDQLFASALDSVSNDVSTICDDNNPEILPRDESIVCDQNNSTAFCDNLDFLQEDTSSSSGSESVSSLINLDNMDTDISLYANHGNNTKNNLWMTSNSGIRTIQAHEPLFDRLVEDIDFSWLSSDSDNELQDINPFEF